MKLSIVDICPIGPGQTPDQAIRASLDLARLVDRLGYERFWLAEHHGLRTLASHAPEVLIPVFAGATQRLKIGSGAVLMNHYSPFKIAEQFKTLHALFPGRIDLGVGRAFAGRVPEVALRRHRDRPYGDDYVQQWLELLAWLTGDFPEGHAFGEEPILPGLAGWPTPWLLGSSASSPGVAGRLGLPFAFAGFINPESSLGAMRMYRDAFQPSGSRAGVQSPTSLLALRVICAETQGEAERQAMPGRAALARLRSGQPLDRSLTVDEAIAEMRGVVPAERDGEWGHFIVGDPDQVKARLERQAAVCGVDEVMMQDMIGEPAARARSYTLLAEAFGLEPLRAAA